MAVNVSAWVWQLELPPYEKLVMLELADHADTKGFCFPKQATIAKRCCMSRGAVNRIIKRLEAGGLLTQTKVFKGGFQRASEYRLSLGKALYLSNPALLCGVTEDHTTESPSVTPIETSVETSYETSVSVESDAEDFSIKISDVLEAQSKSKESIFENFKPTPKGCGDLWRDCRANASDENGFAAELKNKDWSMLNKARLRIPEADFCEVVWKVMTDWVAFTKYAEKHYGAFNMGLNPTVSKFVLQIEAAADYAQPVQLTAEPLTNKPASSKPTSKAMPKTKANTYVNPYHPKPKITAEEKAAIMQKHSEDTE